VLSENHRPLTIPIFSVSSAKETDEEDNNKIKINIFFML
jgi:hypothetical protein